MKIIFSFSEYKQQCKVTYSSGPLLVFDSTLGTRKEGVPKDIPTKSAKWTEYYSSHARNPSEVMELAPWVLDHMQVYSGFIKPMTTTTTTTGRTTDYA
jgi:hypothetical protein